MRAMQDSHLQSKREIADRVGVQESTLEKDLDKPYLALSKGARSLCML